ncbi:hypothetical protein, partial [Azotobacter chroococcum]|uniref:hypothetical protein n=1 Tax=Azotobacter chroococcum TaxID=353 RepID=UPI001A944547
DRLLTHDLEGVVVDCPTIGVSFAFHRGIVSQYDNTFDRLSKNSACAIAFPVPSHSSPHKTCTSRCLAANAD